MPHSSMNIFLPPGGEILHSRHSSRSDHELFTLLDSCVLETPKWGLSYLTSIRNGERVENSPDLQKISILTAARERKFCGRHTWIDPYHDQRYAKSPSANANVEKLESGRKCKTSK